jgi:hypothetical protein
MISKDYYKITIDDPDSKLNIVVYIDIATKDTDCLYKKKVEIRNITEEKVNEPKEKQSSNELNNLEDKPVSIVNEQDCINKQQKICILETSKVIKSSNSGTFGVVINNNYGEEKQFKFNIKFARGILQDGTAAPIQDTSKWTLSDFKVRKVENGKYFTSGIPFQVPSGTKSGTYAFNINVCFDGTDTSSKCGSGFPSLYAPTQQITIEVP